MGFVGSGTVPWRGREGFVDSREFPYASPGGFLWFPMVSCSFALLFRFAVLLCCFALRVCVACLLCFHALPFALFFCFGVLLCFVICVHELLCCFDF